MSRIPRMQGSWGVKGGRGRGEGTIGIANTRKHLKEPRVSLFTYEKDLFLYASRNCSGKGRVDKENPAMRRGGGQATK